MIEPTLNSDPVARSVIGDLGLRIEAVGDELHGTAQVVPTMWVPGTNSLRASVVFVWADVVLGLLAVRDMAPRVPVTLNLDIHLFKPISGTPTMRTVGKLTKAGSAVHACSIDFFDDTGERVGFGHSFFMVAPDPRLSMPAGNWALDQFAAVRGELVEPLAERVGCTRTEPGSAVLHHAPHVLNSSKTLMGGLLAIPVEEAALSAVDKPTTLVSLQMRYLRPVRTGAVASAVVHGAIGEVEVRDVESDALAVVATTRFAEDG